MNLSSLYLMVTSFGVVFWHKTVFKFFLPDFLIYYLVYFLYYAEVFGGRREA